MTRLHRRLLTLAVLALTVGPLGLSVFVLGFWHGDSPCVLCWAQRTVMALVALTGLFVLRVGPRPRHLGLGVLLAAIGLYMGIRHSALHWGRDIGQGFSLEILGAHTYTWSVLIFWMALLAMGALLMTLRDGGTTRTVTPLRGVERLAAWAFLIVIGANALQAFASTGPPPFMGQGDPVRFSFDPRHWVWSLEEWASLPISLRGRYGVEKPSVDAIRTDPASSPFAGLPVLPARRRLALATPLDGPVTDLAYDAEADRFAVSTIHGIHVVTPDFAHVERRVIVDAGFSVDLGRLAGLASVGPRTWLAVSENKSFVIVRENDAADARRNYRYFRAGGDAFDEVRRSRLATVRARLMYVLSAAYDPASRSVFTISVPNARHRQLVVSRFDAGDMMLGEEFVPGVDATAAVAWRADGRSLGDLVITGATAHEGWLHALSATDATLVSLDPARRTLVSACTLEGLDRPVGLAVRRGELHVIDGRGRVTVYGLPDLPALAATN